MKGDKVNEMIKASITSSKAGVSESHRFNVFYSRQKYEIFNEDESQFTRK
jgi:hypothetical protein